MKEFEKLLQQEENRKNKEKALLMIKLGLFEQKREKTFDFDNKELITNGAKYRGLYDLYEDQTTGDLYYVYPLTEDDKEEGSSPKTPYEYDIIAVETVTDEEFNKIRKAGAHEKTTLFQVLLIIQIIFLCITTIALIPQMVFLFEQGQVWYAVLSHYTIETFGLIGIQAGLLLVNIISLRKFKSN